MKHKTSYKQKLALILLSIVSTFLLIEAGMRLTGFFISTRQSIRNHQVTKEDGAVRVLCIGESTTFSGTLEHSYPSVLEKILNQRKTDIKFRVINEGMLGVTSNVIRENLKEKLDQYAPDIVVTMIGINDGRNDVAETRVIAEEDHRWERWLSEFKVYKLFRHIWLHAHSKYGEEDEEKKKFFHSGQDSRLTELMEQAYDHIDNMEFDEAEVILRKALVMAPEYSPIYSSLGGIYAYRNEKDTAITYLNKAIGFDPKNEEAYSQLGMRYFYAMNYPMAEQTFLALVRNIPDSDEAYEKLAQIYFKQKEYGKLEEILKRGEEKFPDSYIFSKMWASYFLIQGRSAEAEQRFAKAADLDARYLSPRTVDNYRAVKEMVLDRGIKLVSVQYPLRKLGPLKRMVGEDGAVVFVDNEDIFKNAVARGSYEQYFVDNFAGDFGHFSMDGNELIAENIADAIITNFFN